MSRPAKYDVLFEPIAIGPKTMKNRFYQAPQCTGFGDVFPGGQAHHRAVKAEGGWAVVNTEATTIAPEFDWAGQMTPSRLWDADDARNWRLMVERAHEHGALVGIELHAGGAFLTGFDSRLPARHVHARLEQGAWLGALIEMDRADIQGVQRQYAQAARRAREVGFDIINVWGGESASLPVLFLMNLHNRRTDEYGGSLENRARFWLETLELVREEVGDECAIAARFCIDSLHGTPEGIRVDEEGVGFIELADHLVDFWDLQVGGENAELWIKDAGPSRFYGENFQAPWVAKARAHTAKPIIGVGRFTNPDTMVEAIESGQVDIIGAARPTIADPFLPKKIEEGRLDEIRECIGCNVCVSRINAGWHVICTQNATAGEEYRRGWHPERFIRASNSDRDVLIVGAGPAGLECAIVLAKRGMRRVHLVDEQDDVGGHLRWVATLPGMGEWRKVIDWRKIQLVKQRRVIEVILKERLEPEAVIDYGAELVVVASGSIWDGSGANGHSHSAVEGADASRADVFTPEQVVRDGEVIAGERVVVFDTEGYFMGVSLAEKLARDGHQVHLITPFEIAAPYMRFTGEAVHMLPLIRELGIKVSTGAMLRRFADGRAFIGGDAPEGVVEEADALVLTTQRLAAGELYQEVSVRTEDLSAAGIEGVFRIGDCVAPRQQVADAIFDGHRLGREIDSAQPAIARPWIRERRVLGASDAHYDALVTSALDGASDEAYVPSSTSAG
jgi:dimethylamine/trimethylamine dehydrogenase